MYARSSIRAADASYINYISDKATSVGGGVLEALAMLTDIFRG